MTLDASGGRVMGWEDHAEERIAWAPAKEVQPMPITAVLAAVPVPDTQR